MAVPMKVFINGSCPQVYNKYSPKSSSLSKSFLKTNLKVALPTKYIWNVTTSHYLQQCCWNQATSPPVPRFPLCLSSFTGLLEQSL